MQPSPTSQPEPTSGPTSASETDGASPSVLTQDTDSISELFARDYKEWTEEDMTRMITELRKRRRELDAAPAKKTKAEKAPKIEVAGKSAEDLLNSLGL